MIKITNRILKINFIIFVIGVIILCGLYFSRNVNEISTKVGVLRNYDEETLTIGQNGYVSSSVITQRKTGTGPFDADDEAGNDSTEDNDVVRSFDQITWTIENTMKLKNEASGESYKGGVINIKAELPSSCSNLVSWDLNSMKWIENGEVSEDGRILTGEYSLSTKEVTVPGKQTLVYVLQVLGATNGLDITPTFTTNLAGNNDSEKCVIIDSSTIVSAAPRLNILLRRNSNMNYRSYFDDATGNETNSKTETSTYGRLQGYGITLQLYNTSKSKKLKGIEFPKGDITFDLTFNELIETTDVTFEENFMPKVWDYKGNSTSNTGNNGKNMYWMGMSGTKEARQVAPYNSGSTRRTSCYDGGDWNIVQDTNNPNVYHVTVSNYKFDTENVFPTNNGGDGVKVASRYDDNIGCFSSGYVQAIMQMPENVGETQNIYMKAEASNLYFKSLSDQECNVEQKNDDNLSNVSITLYPAGSFSKYQTFHSSSSTSSSINASNVTNLGSTDTAGDSYIPIGGQAVIVGQANIGASNESITKRIHILQKFDDEGLQPLENANINSGLIQITMNGNSTKGTLKLLYAAKPDKTGWIDDDEMQDTREEQLIYFSSYQELKDAGFICCGVLIENTDITGYPSSSYYYGIRVKTADSATIGSVYQTVNDLRVWYENTETNNFSWLDQEYEYNNETGLQYINLNYPTPDIEQYNGITTNIQRYVKTAYDENGQIISGTHGGGYKSGNSILVIGADLKINKSIETKNTDGTTKINYDIGKNETTVTYKINPSITNTLLTHEITEINLKITETLPKGLTYVPGSCNYAEPEITTNADESTTLVWYKYNCSSNVDIEPITYNAHIDEETPNGKQYETVTTVDEIIAEGESSKIGNSRKEDRIVTNSIQIINLSSYSLYKTTETPIIEVNGDVHYKITVLNKTDDNVSAFQMLDILPYNGDNRDTDYQGTYTVSNITLNQINTTTNEIITVDNYKIKTTNDASVKTSVTSKDSDLGDGWLEVTSGAEINAELKAFAVIGELPGRAKLEVDMILKTNGNKPYDKYNNSASAQTNTETEEIVTPIIEAKVIKRMLDGKVWFDKNKDGLINEEESYLSGVNVTLLNADGTKAQDVNGNEIATVTTGTNGYYKFEDMKKGDYKVQIEYNNEDGIREITKKNVGLNIEINSKFNSSASSTPTIAYTDVIEGLNSIASPELKVEHQNAGITYKDTQVIVHHYIEGTTTRVPLKTGGTAGDVTIEGIIKDSYTTNPVEVPEYYELVTTPRNATGTMTEDAIVVTYYYRLKKYPYTVNYIDKDTNTKIEESKQVESVTYGTIINTADEIKTYEKYTYDSADKESLTIGTETNEITLYYIKKNGTVTTKYIDKNTGEEILDQDGTSLEEQTADKVDKSYTTIKKNIDGYTYVEDTGNTTGVYTVSPIEVVYYYKQNARVIVNYIDKITGNNLDTLTKNGLVGDSYTSQSKDFNKYVLVEKPTTETVTMTPEEIVLNYYYVHVSGGVVEKHIDDITGEILYNKTHTGNEGDAYNIPSKEFSNYDLVEEKMPSNSSGIMTKEDLPIEVKYYYKYKTQVTTKYIDKITGEPLTDDIVQPGHEGDRYTTENKTFENYDLVELPSNNNGTMTKEAITVTYYYAHKSAGVTVNHYDVITGEKLKAEQNISGHEGDDYETTEETFEGYDLVEDRYPANSKGKMTIDETRVDYYYKYRTTVTAKYIDKITGEEISEKVIIPGYENDEYRTELKEIEDYDYIETELPENAEGRMTKDPIEVIYYYKKPAKVIVNYVEDGTEESLAEKTIIEGHQKDEYETEPKEIKYYKLIEEKYPENAKGEMDDTINVTYYYRKLTFNLKVDKDIESVTLNGQGKTKNNKLSKVEINRKKINGSSIEVVYKIKVTNDGELAGKTQVKENIPNGMSMNSSKNNGWVIKDSVATIEIENIKPGETKEYKVVLDWIGGDSNLGTLSNIAELSNIDNDAKYDETTTDDNKSNADVIIAIGTGEKTYIIIAFIALGILSLAATIVIIESKQQS